MAPLGDERPQDDDAPEQKQDDRFVRRDIPDHTETDEGPEDQDADAESAAYDVHDSVYIHLHDSFHVIFAIFSLLLLKTKNHSAKIDSSKLYTSLSR